MLSSLALVWGQLRNHASTAFAASPQDTPTAPGALINGRILVGVAIVCALGAAGLLVQRRLRRAWRRVRRKRMLDRGPSSVVGRPAE